MKKETNKLEDAVLLRQKAEQLLKEKHSAKTSDLTEANTIKLLYELEVSQIKLEMKKDELKKAFEAIEDSKLKYFELYDLAPVAYITLDKLGSIINLNLTAATLLGDDKASLLNKNFTKYISRDFRDTFYLHLTNIIKTVKRQTCEMRLIKKDGTEFDGQLICTPYLNEDKEILNIRFVIIDITERKKSEKVQAALYNISNAMNTVDNLKEFFFIIKKILGNVIDTSNFFIALYDEKTDVITLPFLIDEKDLFETFPAGKTLVNYVIQTGKPLLGTSDVVDELTQKGLIETIGTPSEIWLGVPLRIDNKIIGVISVQSYDNPDLFTEKELVLLTFVAEEISQVIKHIQANVQIRKDLSEKNTLLKEIYHRTQNNMQVISSMLKIKSRQSNNEFVLETFKDIVQKIQTMSLVHQKLYEAEDLSRINLKEYIEDLVRMMVRSSNFRPKNFSYNLELEDIFITIDSAIPLGLVLNEMINSMFKYSFPNDKKGELVISLEQARNGDIKLQFADNGVGLPARFDPETSKSMRFKTIYSLVVNQLLGSLDYEVKDGLKWYIKFKDDCKLRI